MAYYTYKNIVWVLVSLEELLRVSSNTGLSQNKWIVFSKKMRFDNGATCDDLLLLGIEKAAQSIYVHLHLVEVKIGQNDAGVMEKVKDQIINTYKGCFMRCDLM